MADDYPLNCLTDTGDGFSGWFAISNPKKCNDFCYWSITYISDNATASSSDSREQYQYTVFNTANPHNVTVVIHDNFTSYWECVYDSASDNVLTLEAVGERWVDTYHKFVKGEAKAAAATASQQSNVNGIPFPYLKCQKGSREELSTWDGELVQSALFWECWIAICVGVLLLQLIVGSLHWRNRRRRYRMIRGSTGDVSSDDADAVESEEELGFHSLQLSESVNDMPPTLDNLPLSSIDRFDTTRESEHLTPRCKLCTPLATKLCNTAFSRNKWKGVIRIMLILALNILMAFSIAFSSISLMEINNSPYFRENMRQWTPACSNPDLVCTRGNTDINNESTKPNRDAGPFSYLIASDAQLNWFNGEFAQMGLQNVPPACSPTDSCWSCTKKHGHETNMRLKRGWESVMLGQDVGMDTLIGLPVPDTLIMNGDLTAYFHPSEKHAYDSIYKDIRGLENYFPSLGNHDIEHMNGAMYGGDQWSGPPNCNIEHAIGYFKSGFCGQVPNFHSDRIVRYDASSLAYSWEEGRYHFVHTHYYPTYEMASMDVRSSMDWLDNDLTLARDAGFTTILFVHAANYLNPAMERVILGKNVVAIIAGHDHRCFHRKCEAIYPIHEDQLESGLQVEKCIPAAYDTCEVLNGENLVYVKDIDLGNVDMPQKKLKNRERTDQPLCPKPAPFYINETDNTLLCRKVRYNHPNFPFKSVINNSEESIPMFWSGSSSFETFLRADFLDDRIIINAMTLLEDGNVSRYIDANTVPNARYPYHEADDVAEIMITLK